MLVPHFQAEHATAMDKAVAEFAESLSFVKCPCMKDCDQNMFLPAILDDQASLQELMAVQHDADAFDSLKTLAMVTNSVRMVTIAQADLLLDKARIAVAALVCDMLSMPPCFEVETIGEEVVQRHFVAPPECYGKVQDTWKAVNASVAFLASVQEPDAYTPDQKATLETKYQNAKDGVALVRLECTGLKSKWTSSLQMILDALKAVIPDNWREYCVDDPDEELILTNVVDNENLEPLLDMITNLTDAQKLYVEVLAKISPPDGPEYKLDNKLKTSVKDTLEEGQLMIAVRACENVTLKKLPLCKSQKSRTATAREAKRLIGKLDGPDVPNVCMKRLDEAAAGGKA